MCSRQTHKWNSKSEWEESNKVIRILMRLLRDGTRCEHEETDLSLIWIILSNVQRCFRTKNISKFCITALLYEALLSKLCTMSGNVRKREKKYTVLHAFLYSIYFCSQSLLSHSILFSFTDIIHHCISTHNFSHPKNTQKQTLTHKNTIHAKGSAKNNPVNPFKKIKEKKHEKHARMIKAFAVSLIL